jgi:hypothetical protein
LSCARPRAASSCRPRALPRTRSGPVQARSLRSIDRLFLIVSTTLMSLIFIGSTLSGLVERITRSASLPGSNEPFEASSPCCSAPQIGGTRFRPSLAAKSCRLGWTSPPARGRFSKRRRPMKPTLSGIRSSDGRRKTGGCSRRRESEPEAARLGAPRPRPRAGRRSRRRAGETWRTCIACRTLETAGTRGSGSPTGLT